ncbi:MAG: MBL fold metallo-hydrolase [Betaproteobacteria bacterium]|nr:MBL fold metallo-hydrolase [Betaproteobacteria bacterium]
MFFRQSFDSTSSTYTYILADPATKAAVIIDPVAELADRDLAILREQDFSLQWILDTHVHADHVTGANSLKAVTGAKTAVGLACGAIGYDRSLVDDDEIRFGGLQLRTIATPGHTPGSMSFYCKDRVFTGDTLLIGSCGRSDFQNGDPEALYYSITERLFTLDDDTLVYPAHDYKGRRVSSIGEEKALNPRLAGKSREDFVTLMGNLGLPPPKLLLIAVPANLQGGVIQRP